MPLQATSGAASYDAFGGGVAAVPAYIEEVFSTFLYKGDGVSNADFVINNGIDLQNEGGLVWIKRRDVTENYALTHTGQSLNSNGFYPYLQQGAGAITANDAYGINAFTTTGLTLRGRSGPTANEFNSVGSSMASWSFRKKPKFFDVVTYTGDNTARTIAHDLGSVPGCIIIKRTDSAGSWWVYHTSLGATKQLVLNSTSAQETTINWNDTAPTSTVFSLGGGAGLQDSNINGATYVAYLFANDAGGFGLTGTDNVISCGSYTGDSTSLQSINLGYEPQWILIKSASIAGTEWAMLDNMRGVATGGVDAILNPNTNIAEASPFDRVDFTATGFNLKTSSSIYNETGTYIYIAIRRGPMKVPTSGTSVFNTSFAQSTAPWMVSGFPMDAGIKVYRPGGGDPQFASRLTGTGRLFTNTTNAEASNSLWKWDYMNGYINSTGATNDQMSWNFRRAPGFFDEVCYTGTGSATTVTHNLQAVPELIITKCRGDAFGWAVYSSAVGNTAALFLETTAVPDTNSAYWNNTTPTSTVFSVGSANRTNRTSLGMVAYLFATCAGVSKVGNYTGTGTTLQVDCGFTGGARFVLIKRTDSTGDWYVWDSARGIVAGNDPYLLLNSTAAEVTSTDYIDTYSAGFEISSTAPAAINASGGTYIFLAIA